MGAFAQSIDKIIRASNAKKSRERAAKKAARAVHRFCCNGCGEDVRLTEAVEDEEGYIWHAPCQATALKLKEID